MMHSRQGKILIGISTLISGAALAMLAGGMLYGRDMAAAGQSRAGAVGWMLAGGILLLTAGACCCLYLRKDYRRRLTELEQDRDHWQRQAMLDAFTGVSHKQRMHELTEAAVTDASSQPRMLLLIDIDDLKYINDHYGHEKGDAAILSLVDLLKPLFPAPDILGRVGGDEFMALAYTDENSAEARIHTLFKNLLSRDTAADDEPCLRVSVGLAVIPEGGLPVDEAYRRVDSAMYRAKRQGSPPIAVEK